VCRPRLASIVMMLMTAAWTLVSLVFGQVMGEEAELERLQNKAEEAMANDDADAAAMNIGKAALMAGQLANRQKTSVEANGIAALNRSFGRRSTPIGHRHSSYAPAVNFRHRPGCADR
jgi:hypothetical protein